MIKYLGLLAVCLLFNTSGTALLAQNAPVSLTPPSPPAPRINGPAVFGVRPGSPIIYNIPATGTRPINFAAENLPEELTVDAATGMITGTLNTAGEYAVILKASNKFGNAQKKFRIIVGSRIALTPPMGWSSWNAFGATITQEKIANTARAMVKSGLSQHGFTYINMDDGWQGKREGKYMALQGNEKFPNMGALVDTIHKLGLKAGIYSTPWETSYAKFAGGSAETASGEWKKIGNKFGAISFAKNDADQWAEWGIDYLKYDWPIDVLHTEEMSKALHSNKRDIVFSLSNSGKIADAEAYGKLAESWRTTGDIYDAWQDGDAFWHFSVSEIGFSQDKWATFAAPGHWNDLDMLVVGQLGWGPKVKPTRLTPDEQYSHITLWCMLSAPLILGCDLDKLDDFTIGLLTNDEVLDVNQDELGKQATRVGSNGAIDIFVKPLADGAYAIAAFNRGDAARSTNLNKAGFFGVSGRITKARDLWRQQDIDKFNANRTSITVPAHGVVLLKVWVGK
ncbi:alpha-galactosidase [Mucilaginibacter corticis]|uniref:Alpha-galactosidase n=1 Tax=Mucilaginibacter corticis TaxID=2597670 RepID=A0A556M9I6_9SPHI|nr:putative Ig domain-containing protein [Mucilaginibacter corticis]TSJ36475.1 alpha-galactosidase [Mucilaginibacter corticis]